MYDVCVIGSGPAGGILMGQLTRAGAKVVLIDGGRVMQPADFHHHVWPYQLPYRGIKEGEQPAAAFPPSVTTAIRYESPDNVRVDRIRAVGGRSIHWNGECHRFSEDDFREGSLHGIEEDWPIRYEELAPYYSYIEKMIGVSGSRENLSVMPDGDYLPALKPRCSEVILHRSCAKMGIPVIPARKAVLTVPYDNRPPCHYCDQCMSGCDVGAIFTIPNSILPKAETTGNYTLMAGKIAREILVDSNGMVRAAVVVDTTTKAEEEVKARIFVVSCGAIDGPRLLLNSRSSRFPNGIANSNDLVGRHLTGSIGTGLIAFQEELVGRQMTNTDGATNHTIIPRFTDDKRRKGKYIGGFQFHPQLGTDRFPYQVHLLKGFGESFKKRVRFLQPGLFTVLGLGKPITKIENRVMIDPERLDSYGMPLPVVKFSFNEYDRALYKDMKDNALEILHAMKCDPVYSLDSEPWGFASHEIGTTRMGTDPKKSVVNSHGQTHDVKNLFVLGGSTFTTFPEKNPTLTIMALSARTGVYMAKEVKKGNL